MFYIAGSSFWFSFLKITFSSGCSSKILFVGKKLFLYQTAKLISVIDDKKVWAEFVGGKWCFNKVGLVFTKCLKNFLRSLFGQGCLIERVIGT
jgi:hypothetical protein